MAIAAGTVSVVDGELDGSGLALALGQAKLAGFTFAHATAFRRASKSDRLRAIKAFAVEAQAEADAIAAADV